MCGIAGIVNALGFDPQRLISMTQQVQYRGPDGFGFAFFSLDLNARAEVIHNQQRLPTLARPQVGLGNRRLAILDRSTRGNMPMQTEDGDLCITHNGEVYNYIEIRQELEQLGHCFRSGTDTEVILRAYKQWGVECLIRFNGMWAFAIWDRRRKSLFCSRDRFGVKPFYYLSDDNLFLFASEIKQILGVATVSREADDDVVLAFLENGLVDHTSKTFFRAVRQLRSGHYLIVDLSSPAPVVHIQRYWDLALVQNNQAVSDAIAETEFLTRFDKSIELRMRSDVPVGSCLSGGLDSSSIVCSAKKLFPARNFHTLSAESDAPGCDERAYVSAVAQFTGVESHTSFPRAQDFWTCFESLLWHHDEPIKALGVYAQWTVMEAARREGIPVLLDGQGGDEILCGYRKFYYFYLWDLLKKLDPKFVYEGMAFLRNRGREAWDWDAADRYLPSFLRTSSVVRHLSPQSFQWKAPSGIAQLGSGTGLLDRQKTDLFCSSIPELLRYEDRNSMAHSVETRLPFLDYRLVEFTVNCRPELKMRHGWSKWLLRSAMRGVLPEEVRLRRSKLGWNLPQSEWIRGHLAGEIRKVFTAPELAMRRFLDQEKLVHEWENFVNRRRGAFSDTLLFRVLSLEIWARVFSAT